MKSFVDARRHHRHPDLTTAEPLLVLTRDQAGGFTTRLDNTGRCAVG
ncbi:hypothetical protein [Streptomyces sp. CB02959]|nr:hypothetical protein [Streptomyces sp. CB02959]